MFPIPNNGNFINCRQVVAAILYAKLRDVSPDELNSTILSFSHSERMSSLESLSDLQRQTVQSFISTVYAVDNYLYPRAIRAVGRSSMRIAEAMHLDRMRFLVADGSRLTQLCLESCRCDASSLSDIFYDKPSEVVSRDAMPSRWRSVITYITIFMRHTMISG